MVLAECNCPGVVTSDVENNKVAVIRECGKDFGGKARNLNAEIGKAGRQQADTRSLKFRFPFCGAKIRIHDIKVNKSDFFCFGGFKCNVESKLCFAGAEIADNYKIFFHMFIHAFIERCTAVFVSEDNLPAVSAAHGFKTGNNAFGGTHSVNRRAHDSAGIARTFADRVKTLKPGCFAVLIPCNANRGA